MRALARPRLTPSVPSRWSPCTTDCTATRIHGVATVRGATEEMVLARARPGHGEGIREGFPEAIYSLARAAIKEKFCSPGA